jgi:hypothetical protein
MIGRASSERPAGDFFGEAAKRDTSLERIQVIECRSEPAGEFEVNLPLPVLLEKGHHPPFRVGHSIGVLLLGNSHGMRGRREHD